MNTYHGGRNRPRKKSLGYVCVILAIFISCIYRKQKKFSIPEAATRAALQEKLLLKNFSMFTGKQLCWSPFLIELQACNFIKRDSDTATQVNIAKFSRTPILKKIFEQLPLEFLHFTVNISSQGLVSALDSIAPPQGPLQCLKRSLQGAQQQVLFLFKKREISRDSHSLPLDFTSSISRLSFYNRTIEQALIELSLLENRFQQKLALRRN